MTETKIIPALRQRLHDPIQGTDGHEATLTFDRDFPGFNGHFKGNPMVPGVCLIQVFELLANWNRPAATRIKTVKKLKLFRPIVPGTTAKFVFTITASGQYQSCRGMVWVGNEKIAQVNMELEEQ